MSLSVLDNVSLALGGKVIVDGLSLRVAEHDRIGLIGPNGAGKTTLLRLMVGQQTPDSGTVHRRRELRIGYLPQEIDLRGGRRLLPYVLESVPGRADLARRIEAVDEELARVTEEGDEEETVELAGQAAELHDRMARFDREYSSHQAERILAGLGFRIADHDRDLGELSGGWRMRALLAGLLFQQPDLLLLDEPTNHLDMPSAAWFAGFLRAYRGAFVLISHDREFLNEQIERVVSFEVEGVRSYAGDYESYRKQREEEETVLEARAANLAREREHIERFVRRFRAKATKARQVQSRIKQLEKMEVIEPIARRKVIRFRFPPTERPGRDVLTVRGLRKAYGDNVVLDDVDLTLVRGDRVAIVGVNGAGKTTLLRVLAGEIPRDAGEVELGLRVKLGYYAQHHVDVLDPGATAYDEVARRCAEGGNRQIRAALGALLFNKDEEIEKRVGVLSGGERARVALAQLLVDPGNVLLMDEPTNHLDLDSSESLAGALETFDGTLLFVSHNRSFVRRLATRIWHVVGGKVQIYPGTLDEYISSVQHELNVAGGESGLGADGDRRAANRASDKERKRRQAERRNRLYPLRRRAEELEARVTACEDRHRRLTDEINDPALYQDAARRDDTLRRFEQTKKELERLTAEWIVAQETLEQAESEDAAD